MKYEIVTYGHPVLRQKAKPVPRVNEEIRQVAADMLEAMYANQGLGLAAQQVGLTWALCVIDVPPALDVEEKDGPRMNPGVAMPLVLVNLEIVAESDEKRLQSEGCLSFPEIHVPVRRAASIQIAFLNLEGNRQSLEVHGMLARAVRHEHDHLNGILLADRMSALKKISLSGQLKRMKKETLAKLAGHG